MIPVAVILLPSKTKNCYMRMLRRLIEAAGRLGLQFNPQTICIDFETAMISAINDTFPQARVRGCLFHFCQAIWRKVQTLGLAVRYKEDDAFNRIVRRASALPLVPRDEIHNVWMQAMNESDDPEIMRLTWVDELVAVFPAELWWQYDNLNGVRTNNHLEGWHSRMNKTFSHPHPNIYRLIDMLKQEQRG